MEQYFCAEHIELNDSFMEGAIRSIMKNVRIVLQQPDNYDARAEIFYTTTLGCNGIYSLGNHVFGTSTPEETIAAMHDFYREIGIPMTLPEVGIDESRLTEIAHHIAVNECLENAWAPLQEADILSVLQDCMK